MGELWPCGVLVLVWWFPARVHHPLNITHPSYIFLQTNWHSIQHGVHDAPWIWHEHVFGLNDKSSQQMDGQESDIPISMSHFGWLPDFFHPFSTPKTADSFIDGDHRYQAVVDDLRLWSPKVAPGGCSSGCCWSASLVMLSSSLVMFTMKIAINRNISHLKKYTHKEKQKTYIIL